MPSGGHEDPLQPCWPPGCWLPGAGQVATPGSLSPTLSRLPRKRRGAINSKQLTYLEKYRPKQRLRFKDPHTHKTRCCVM